MVVLLNKLENIVALDSTSANIIAPLDSFQRSKIINKLPLISFDNQLTELYKFCDGFSLGDLCFYSLKKNNQRMDINTAIDSLWKSNEILPGYFLPFSNNSTGYFFGLLLQYKDAENNYAIGCYNSNLSFDKIFLVAKDFENFLESIINQFSKDDLFEIDLRNLQSKDLDIQAILARNMFFKPDNVITTKIIEN